MKTPVEDTYCEAFDGLGARLLITAADEKRLKRAAFDATALPCTVMNESEAGVECFIGEDETPDGRKGALIQVWVNKNKGARERLEYELGKRIRQGILVVPSTSLFNALNSEDKIDMTYRVGNCGDGYEKYIQEYDRELIDVPIMMGSFKIERYFGFQEGIMGGNLWLMCNSQENALKVIDKAEKSLEDSKDVALTFREGCSAGSKAGGKYKHIGPSTNEKYCPTLRNILSESNVPDGVEAIPEIIINGFSLESINDGLKKIITSIEGMEGLIKISAGNYGGKLGKHKIQLSELTKDLQP